MNPATPSSIGKGTVINLQVVDDRDSLVVGSRGVNDFGADITVPGILPILRGELMRALQAKGFTVIPDSEADTNVELEARLRAFKYLLKTGFWTGRELVNVVISVEADRGARDFDKTYRSHTERSRGVVAWGSDIDKRMSRAFANVISQIASDHALLEYLAWKPEQEDIPPGHGVVSPAAEPNAGATSVP